MKPLFFLLVAGLIAVAALTSGPGPRPAFAMHPCKAPPVAGDLWGDGAVQSSDAQALLIHVAQAGYDHWCAPLDVDCNSDVNSVDALKILRYVAVLPYSQHEPCPDIGTTSESSALNAHSCGPPDYYGDISDNDSVGAEDAMLILREVTNLFPHTTCPSDPDCDGSITARDALVILRYVVDLPYSQHEPCPDIGTVID